MIESIMNPSSLECCNEHTRTLGAVTLRVKRVGRSLRFVIVIVRLAGLAASEKGSQTTCQ